MSNIVIVYSEKNVFSFRFSDGERNISSKEIVSKINRLSNSIDNLKRRENCLKQNEAILKDKQIRPGKFKFKKSLTITALLISAVALAALAILSAVLVYSFSAVLFGGNACPFPVHIAAAFLTPVLLAAGSFGTGAYAVSHFRDLFISIDKLNKKIEKQQKSITQLEGRIQNTKDYLTYYKATLNNLKNNNINHLSTIDKKNLKNKISYIIRIIEKKLR